MEPNGIVLDINFLKHHSLMHVHRPNIFMVKSPGIQPFIQLFRKQFLVYNRGHRERERERAKKQDFVNDKIIDKYCSEKELKWRKKTFLENYNNIFKRIIS